MLILVMFAASAFLINIRDGGAAPYLTKGGCFLRGGTFSVTCVSPTLILDGYFVGGVFQTVFETSSTSSLTLFLGGANTSLSFATPCILCVLHPNCTA